MHAEAERRLREGRYDLAHGILEERLRGLDPGDPAQARAEALHDLAEVRFRLGDVDAARRTLEASLALSGSLLRTDLPASGNLLLARIELERGDRRAARTALEKAAALLGGPRADALEVCARVEIAEGRLDAAEATLTHLESMAGPQPALRGRLLLEQRRWDPARALLERARGQARPPEERARIEILLARAAQGAGRPEAAEWRRKARDTLRSASRPFPPELARPFLASLGRGDAADGRPSGEGLAAVLETGDAGLTARLMQVMAAMNSETEIGPLLSLILDATLEMCHGRRGLLFLTRLGQPAIEVTRHREGRALSPEELEYSRSIVRTVARTGEPLVAGDATRDPRFGNLASVAHLDLRSVLCLPLRTRSRSIGVVYVDNNDVASAFRERELNVARVLADQAALAIEHALLLERSAHDPATGVASHAHLEARLEHEVTRAGRQARPAAFLAIDLDQFRRINDRCGRETGTAILQAAARVVGSCLRSYDLVGRHGGDAFEAVLPESGFEGMAGTAQRILEAFRSKTFEVGPLRMSVTVSIGGAVFPEDGRSARDLQVKAEEALHAARAAGGNRFQAASDRPALPAPAPDEPRPLRSYPGIVGRSAALRRALAAVDRLVDIPDPVLLEGETGTGKELLARAIHGLGPRAAARFVAVNCGAIPETLLESELFGSVRGAYTGADADRPGLFEVAHRGTLFLDEIESMPDAMQAKLLRALDEKKVRRIGAMTETPADVRILAAANQPLRELVSGGKFRSDIYYRLSAFTLKVPPLRERTEDIPVLAEHFLREQALETGAPPGKLTAGALAVLLRYPWPGNVRELRNELRRIGVTAGASIAEADIAASIRDHAASAGASPRGDYRERLAVFEKRILLEALETHRWNLSAAARALQMDRNTLRAKMELHAIRRA